ncbi:MAG: hypothetical protein J5979_03745 [Lachnospiraceae bacterium]|nr:hypothetical protein [Lachnospiraceae bacterium]
MSIYPDIGCPTAGLIAEPGTYVCMNCPHDNKENDKAIIILDKKEKLPVCPVCGEPYWSKV